jgi:phosphopantothenoylcysteine decarboxylase
MANILLGVTGSVAAIKTPLLFEELIRRGHPIKVVATQASLYFFDPVALGPLPTDPPSRNPAVVVLDEDEWPGREQGRRYTREDEVLHIELRRWANLMVIAPLDANTLAKLANGLADNCLTCVWRAWDPTLPVVLAPAMNTLMWRHPATSRHLRQVVEDMGGSPPAGLALEDLIGWVNENMAGLRVVGPQAKRLACGDVGMGAMAEFQDVAATVGDLLV